MKNKDKLLALIVIVVIVFYIFVSTAIIDNLTTKDAKQSGSSSGEVKLYVTGKANSIETIEIDSNSGEGRIS